MPDPSGKIIDSFASADKAIQSLYEREIETRNETRRLADGINKTLETLADLIQQNATAIQQLSFRLDRAGIPK